jgi:hypothetical protein
MVNTRSVANVWLARGPSQNLDIGERSNRKQSCMIKYIYDKCIHNKQTKIFVTLQKKTKKLNLEQ